MAQRSITKAERRWLHFISGDLHPNVVHRAVRELKRGHRRLTRRTAKQALRTPTADSDF